MAIRQSSRELIGRLGRGAATAATAAPPPAASQESALLMASALAKALAPLMASALA